MFGCSVVVGGGVAVVEGSRDVGVSGRGGGNGSEESGVMVSPVASGPSAISISSLPATAFGCGWVLSFLWDPPFSSFAPAAAAAAVAAALLGAAEERLFELAVVIVDGAGEFLAVVVAVVVVVVGVGLFT